VWKKNGGPFVTKHELELRFVFPEFAPSKEITWTVAVDESETRPTYDMIIGRDLQKSLGMDILWSVGQISWDGITVPMKSVLTATRLNKIAANAAAAEEQAEMLSEVLEMHLDSDVIIEATNWARCILDANYEKVNIKDYVMQQSNLTINEKSKLKSLLVKYKSLFDGSLGKLNGAKASFELKDSEKTYHMKPFSVLKHLRGINSKGIKSSRGTRSS